MLRHDCEQLAKEKRDELYSCPLCPHTSRSEKVLEKHYEEEHEEIKQLFDAHAADLEEIVTETKIFNDMIEADL